MTIKQQIAINKVVENGGNISRAMRDSGYSEATINNPYNLTRSKAFQDLCEEIGLTDELLVLSLVDDIKNKKWKPFDFKVINAVRLPNIRPVKKRLDNKKKRS
ncbi:MAG: hypothetical protein JWN37_346 [Candidatus Nomurabacteria bacterium]|nr:hypothetical protein [Candidatus Nomurabacteria bacterium]